MKIKISTEKRDIKTKNYNEQSEVTLKNFLKFYVESLRISFPDIKRHEMVVMEYLINNDFTVDYFSSDKINELSDLLKMSISNIKNVIKPSMIKKRLIVNVNPNPKNFIANKYLLNETIRNFVSFIQSNKTDVKNIEIKFDFKIKEDDNNRQNN